MRYSATPEHLDALRGLRPQAMLALLLLALLSIAARDASAELVAAGAVPSGFQDTVVFSGLTNPTGVRFRCRRAPGSLLRRP
jgi:hypothetical protein